MPRPLPILLVLYAAVLYAAIALQPPSLSPPSLSAQTVVRLPGTTATLECYPSLKQSSNQAIRQSVIVCPGGSYCWLDYKHEGVEVAQWLQAHGISAYVLRYRVTGWWAWATHYRLLFPGLQPDQPLRDVTLAIDYLHDSLVDSNMSLGIMGFSAGGHLALTVALKDERLCWVAAIYPVVSMADGCTHKRSRRALLGERGQYDPALREAYSLERTMHPGCPPVFLVNCADDPVVDCRNSLLLDSALTANNVPHRYIQYRTGGHGFGVSDTKGTPESRPWRNEFLHWLHTLNLKQ